MVLIESQDLEHAFEGIKGGTNKALPLSGLHNIDTPHPAGPGSNLNAPNFYKTGLSVRCWNVNLVNDA